MWHQHGITRLNMIKSNETQTLEFHGVYLLAFVARCIEEHNQIANASLYWLVLISLIRIVVSLNKRKLKK